MNGERQGVLGRLVECVGRLGEPAERQVGYLVGLGVAPLADELGLEFDDAYKPAERFLTSDPTLAVAAARLAELNRALAQDAVGWTVEDLRLSAEWKQIRTLAAAALDALRK